MGRLYKVFDTRIKEKVALKLIKPEIAADRETIERFSNELRLARKIGHRNVCRMFDLGEAAGAHFITMEYIHGEDLKSMIRMSTGLTAGTVLSVGKQVCEGLAEAHSLGIVHRDLKPQNIMIDRGGNAKIMDFGIARSVREKGITGPSVLIGTPEYMSPEQAEAKDVDQRSDIYSLGIILYEMATGRVPLEGDTALSIAMKHKGEMPKNPRQLNPNIPADLAGVILKCLEKDRAKRYQSAGELAADLDRIEKGLPTTERIVPERKPFTSIDSAKSQWKKLVSLDTVKAQSPSWGTFLKAEILLAERKPGEAVSFLENTPPFRYPSMWNAFPLIAYNMPFLKDVLARAYQQNGDLDKAIAEYERLTTFDPKSVEHFLIHPKYYFRLGRLYEAKGLKAKAVENYRKFLDLWKDADPGQPEVEEAKRKLAGLSRVMPARTEQNL